MHDHIYGSDSFIAATLNHTISVRTEGHSLEQLRLLIRNEAGLIRFSQILHRYNRTLRRIDAGR